MSDDEEIMAQALQGLDLADLEGQFKMLDDPREYGGTRSVIGTPTMRHLMLIVENYQRSLEQLGLDPDEYVEQATLVYEVHDGDDSWYRPFGWRLKP